MTHIGPHNGHRAANDAADPRRAPASGDVGRQVAIRHGRSLSPALLLTAGAWLAVCLATGGASAQDQPGDAARGGQLAEEQCAACHGPTGNPEVEGIPKLAGHFPDYVIDQLVSFVPVDGNPPDRKSDIMEPIAEPLSDQDIKDLAAFYARQPRSPGKARDPGRVGQGEELYMHGNPDGGLPACGSCHRPTGSGTPPFANIAAQDPDYVEQQLTDWMETRGHPGKLMSMIVPHITPDERAALADYIATLPPIWTPVEVPGGPD